MQLLLLIAMLLAGGEPRYAAAVAPPAPVVHIQSAEQATPTSTAEITAFVTEGDSMSPTIASGDRLQVDCSYYRSHKPQRGDIIVFRAPDERMFVKRVIGLPGETVSFERSKLYVGGKLEERMPLQGNASSIEEVKLSGRQLYVLGDNYAHSYDSRYIGPIDMDSVIGKAIGIEHKRQPRQAAVNKPADRQPKPSAARPHSSDMRSQSALKPSQTVLRPSQTTTPISGR